MIKIIQFRWVLMGFHLKIDETIDVTLASDYGVFFKKVYDNTDIQRIHF